MAAFDAEEGIISPGGIGFDINCGMRLVTTNLTYREVRPRLKELIDTLFKSVPAGVGCKGFVKVNKKEFTDVMLSGSTWCVEKGYGWKADIERTESYGRIDWADPSKVSEKAVSRGIDQLGTLGSGNHYLEAQVVHAKHIFDPETAKAFGIHTPEQVVIMVHCGSRGFGHQIGTDYLRVFEGVVKKYNIEVRDRELMCAPFRSTEGQDYYGAMACAANMAFANRQVILHRIREAFEKVFKTPAEKLEMNLVYDVAHNIAKVEEHEIDGKKKKVVVHRKGSTRAFPPGHPELHPRFRDIGQPVLIPGDMGRYSFVLVGTAGAFSETFGSTCHGAGRRMSRHEAKKIARARNVPKELEERGILVRAASRATIDEEIPEAYKDVAKVVDIVHAAGIGKKVVKLTPVGVVKG